jgi:ABC-2 type transport system ATP-binding protein
VAGGSRKIGVLLACASASLGAAPAASARDVVVRSFDGTPIVATFTPAKGLAAGKRAPTVLVGHGWGLTRAVTPQAGTLNAAGYNTLTWDARGFGASGGVAQIDAPRVEARDAMALIDFVARQPEAKLDKRGDPRVGMAGSSYGCGIQWVTAAQDKRVDVIAPTNCWNSLLTSLNKDDDPKAGWSLGLYGLGLTSSFALGLIAPTGLQTGTIDPHITSALTSGLMDGHISAPDQSWLKSRGPGTMVGRIRIPTLITQGTIDTLFTLGEGITNYRTLRLKKVPVKMIWMCAGHGACFTSEGPATHDSAMLVRWFNRWLKGDKKVDTGKRFDWVADDGRLRSASDYPLAPAAPWRARGAGTIVLSPVAGVTSGTLIAATPAIPGFALELTFPPAPRAAQLVGAPRVTLRYRGTASEPATFLYAQVMDVTRNLIVGNQVTPLPVLLDGRSRSVTRLLEPIAAAARPGSRYRVQLIAATNVYSPQRAAGTVRIDSAEAILPVADTTRRAVGPRP